VTDSRRIVVATVAALTVAAVLLVTTVLPAEYGIDPLGTGRLLGLTALADAAAGVIAAEDVQFKRDATEFVLGPYEALEYKYRLHDGASMVFSWKATGAVMYDFHSEPDGAPEGYAESFDKQQKAEAHGTYTAPFSGIHGWYWENPGTGEISISLSTAGFYTEATEFRDGGARTRELPDVRTTKD
jgi:hypothetical protein